MRRTKVGNNCTIPMLSKLTALFHQAAELSSQVLSADENLNQRDVFKNHWKIITDNITDNGSIGIIEERLEAMLELLCSEEKLGDFKDPGTVGPCMEFVLRHKLLDTLFTTTESDFPAGMAQQVLKFYTFLLDRLERPLLHHVSIHQPILLQINSCGDDPSGLLAANHVQFIKTICLRLTRDPRLADFFVKEEGDEKVFLISEALVRLTNSSNIPIMMKAYECLLTCASLHHSSVAMALATGKLPMLLASKLQYHFQLIPPNATYAAIFTCQAGWGTDYAARCRTLNHSPSTYGLGHIEAFFSWLDYCEQIVGSAQAPLGKAVCESIHEIFLSASLLPKLLKAKEEDILIGTSVLARAIQAINCKLFLEELVLFTLREPCFSAAVDATINETVTDGVLVNKLICRIDHINEDVCQVTLRLFDALLQSPLSVVIQEFTNSQPLSHYCIVEPRLLNSARSKLREDITAYLLLIPDNLSSSKDGEQESLDPYLIEAHSEVGGSHQLCRNLPVSTLPTTAVLETRVQTPFLVMLLNKLEALLDQPYEMNLLVSALITRLAASPHPAIVWLFDTHSQERNVYTILKKVAGTLQGRVERTPGLLVHIVEARRRLVGQLTSDLLSMPHNNLLEGAIVLEELVKELSAILFAKTSLNILTLSPR